MAKWSVLVLCVLGATGAIAAPGNSRARNRRASFLSIVNEKPSESHPAPVLPVELPIKLEGYGGVNLPILVLPVPVFTKSDTCDVQNNKEPVEQGKAPPTLPFIISRQQFNEVLNSPSPVPQPIPYYPERPEPHQKPVSIYSPSTKAKSKVPSTSTHSVSQPIPQYPEPGYKAVNYHPSSTKPLPQYEVQYQAPSPQRSGHYQSVQATSQLSDPVYNHFQRHPSYVPHADNEVEPAEEEPIPYSRGRDQLFANSDDLIQSYRQQQQRQPGSPAVVPVGRRLPARIPPAGPDAPLEDTVFGPAPPRPDFGRSMHLRIDLSVPRAGYTEAYEVAWHAESNTARTVVEDGSTVFYRVPLLDGRVQFLEIAVDSTEGDPVRRCTMSPMVTPSSADKRYPGLPDMDQFYFVGYTSAEGRSRVERWHNNVIGKPGESGAAPGESLNFTHHFLVYRDGDDAVPLKYTVMQYSSVLGPAIDGYTHRYELLPAPTAPILPDVATACDVTVQLEEEHLHRPKRQLGKAFGRLAQIPGNVIGGALDFGAAVKSRFNPMSDFLQPTLDPSYDSGFNEFTDKFQRLYRDDKERAVRKAQYINTRRHVNAANRVATTFKTAVNFFADLVQEEIDWFFGAAPEPEEAPPGLAPPEYSAAELKRMYDNLPQDYDEYREKGGVSPVQQQGTCMSCWAFAVAGSTEGALYKKTKKLVPLSPQSLVDCGKEHNTNGCNATWPENAYSYIKEHGIPALEEYQYDAKVHECKAVQPVTRISGYRKVSDTIEGVKVAIFNSAPTVVLIGANTKSFINYDGTGIYEDALCQGHEHAVLAVGWGSAGGEHLIIKNSWGTQWADKGYVRMNPNVCSVTDKPSYAIVKKADILRDEMRATYQEQ